jgi:autotransporter-associated beta strand protein
MTRTLVSLLVQIVFLTRNRTSPITFKAGPDDTVRQSRNATAHRLLLTDDSGGRARFSSLLVAVIILTGLLVVVFVVEAGNAKDFTANTDMTSGTNYSPSGVPTNTDDVRITRTSTATLRITASAATMESLSVANGNAFTISNGTSGATNSTLNLGNSAGFTNTFSGVANDLIYLTGNSTLTIQGPNGGGGAGTGVLNSVLQSSGNFNIGTGSTFTISSVISGSGKSISKTSGGTATLSGANTYAGGTTVSAGVLRLGSDGVVSAGGAITSGPVGTSTVTLSDTSNLSSSSTTARTLQNNLSLSGNITLGNAVDTGALTFNSTDGTNTLSTAATATLTGDTTLTTASVITISDVISGNFNLTKAGSSTLALGGANTYGGNTTINTGTLALTGSGSSANSPTITVAGGATFDVSGRTSTLTLQSSQTLNGTGTVSSGTINCSASGLTMGSTSPLTLLYANGNPTLTVTGGALTLASGNPVTVTVSGSALTAGDYTLISSSSGGSVAGAAPTTVMVVPGGLDTGMAASLQITSGQLILQVATPTAANGNVSGQIVDSNGNPVEGAAVRMTGTQNRLTVSDAQGNYRFDNVETNGFYTVVPTRANYSFSPSQRSFSALGQHTDAAFNASSTGNALNPLDATEYFVRQQYLDFLNREPDESGFNFWVNNIESCGANAQCREAKRIDTSAAFFLSIEFQQTGYLVYRTYQAAYGDIPKLPVPIKLSEFKPDTREIGNGVIVLQSGWEQKLEDNKQAFAAEFVQRPRFASAYPTSITPSEFVDKLFTNAGLTPGDADRTAAINEFGPATTTTDAAARGRALRRVAENATLAQQEFNRAFVLMEYFGYLQRDANTGPDTDFSGYHFWLDKLNAFGGNCQNAEMVKAFLVSGEYRGRFPL